MQPHIHTGSKPGLESNRGFQVWWQMTRPHTLTASFVPVLLGTALALKYEKFHIGLFLRDVNCQYINPDCNELV